ncbi:MAG: hypothetical protein QM597_07595 [Aeromicrobium sp.]|uniref:LptM family lipoprotein n=1 Tax=Aeromicrobium sp. TaxID=1871063 RepID=UPI0039E6C574
MKKILFTSAALATALILSACGDSDSDDSKDSESKKDAAPSYCDLLEDAEAQFEEFDEGDFSDFSDILDTFESLADAAPSEIESDWETVMEGMDIFVDAVDDLGMTVEEFASMSSESDLPEGVDASEFAEVMADLEELNDAKYEDAGDAIEEHASDECGVELS